MTSRVVLSAFLLFALVVNAANTADSQSLPPYKNPNLPVAQRVDDLVSRMTLEEKVSQMMNAAPAIERLAIPKYDWWNEALHGVARAGYATVFPQAIGLAATWDTKLMYQVADVISTEARAKHHEFARNNQRGIYQGLTFWSPNINIFRDPRWGRGQETYGEDPYLTARLAVQFVKGLQGNDPRYFKVIATPKHYAVHSGPEPERHSFDAKALERDLRETYLPAFRATVIEGKAYSIMCAYNRTNGEPCCTHKELLGDILRGEWGFDGYVVSDCWAVKDIWEYHKFVKTQAEASALAVRAGTDLVCGGEYVSLIEAVKKGLVAEADIDKSLKRLMTARFRLGMFDPPEMVPYARIPFSQNDTPEHRQLALKTARESIVLLKNANRLLPLKKDLKSIAVIGPNADAPEVLWGNYNGKPSRLITPLAGIKNAVSPNTKVVYAPGSALAGEAAKGMIEEAVNAAKATDASVLVLGLSASLEGEEMPVHIEGFRGGDRTDLSLPKSQETLLKAVVATGKPVVVVLLSGSAVAVNWANDNVPAILHAWYPGGEGGTAIADVLFGNYNPAGRLPVTFYKSVDQLPPFSDYSMQGRTYRYFKGEPLYPFGLGLSYTKFDYSNLRFSAKSVTAGEPIKVTVDVRNVGEREGDEVVQLYLTDVAASAPVPIRTLVGFDRISLRRGETRKVTFTITPRQMSLIDDAGKRVIEPGEFLISIGGSQVGLSGKFIVSGERTDVAERDVAKP